MKRINPARSIFRLLLGISTSTLLGSCFLSHPYRHQTFTYTDAEAPVTASLVVPKGFDRKESKTDERGNTVQTYYYGGNRKFYISYLPTGGFYQSIDTLVHQPKPYLLTGRSYKGLTDRWWRESIIGTLRIGYEGIGYDAEARFDSAVNSLQLPVRERKRR